MKINKNYIFIIQSNMSKFKICVYAICKNESKFIKRWYESIKGADYICVLDTGSEDDSLKILKSLNIKVNSVKREIYFYI